MQPLVDAIFNSDIHNNGDLNEELWCGGLPSLFRAFSQPLSPFVAAALLWLYASHPSVARSSLCGCMLQHLSSAMPSWPAAALSAAVPPCCRRRVVPNSGTSTRFTAAGARAAAPHLLRCLQALRLPAAACAGVERECRNLNYLYVKSSLALLFPAFPLQRHASTRALHWQSQRGS